MALHWFRQRENRLVIYLALLLLALHLLVINRPVEMILDEQHYVTEANSIIAGEGLLHPEHPSLGKLFIALGIILFGDGTFGWRIFSVLFGSISIILFYLICRKLTTRKHVPILATLVFAFENLSFVLAGVAMLDVFSLTFMLASFLLYLHNRYVSSGVVLALSALAKIPGAFGGAVILLHWILTKRAPKRDGLKFLVSAPLAFLALMPLADYLATGELLYPWERIHYMITTHSSLTFAATTAGNSSYPWDWVLSPIPMAFWYDPSYMAGPSWNLWALIIPAVLFMLYGAIKRNSLCIFSLLWFAGTYLVWIFIELITDRVMFNFYFYPAIGSICLGLGLAIQRMLSIATRTGNHKARWSIRVPIVIWMVSHIAVFIIMGPIV